MKNDTTILPFRQSGSIADALTDLAREGAHRMPGEALKAEADGFVARFAAEHLEDGRQRIVRHGFGPERQIQTGIGAPDVQRPRLRDRIATPDPAERIRLTTILPKWARRPVSLDGLLPVLYLKGISTGDFQEALSAIIGPDARNLSPGVISRLTAGRQAEYDAWTRHDLSARHSICIRADGVCLQARMAENAGSMPVIIGATVEGGKELIGFQVGLRESAQNWTELAWVPDRHQRSRPVRRTGNCSRRWCHGVPERAGQGVSRHRTSAVSGASGDECAELFSRADGLGGKIGSGRYSARRNAQGS